MGIIKRAAQKSSKQLLHTLCCANHSAAPCHTQPDLIGGGAIH
jgi:hypothetical protein